MLRYMPRAAVLRASTSRRARSRRTSSAGRPARSASTPTRSRRTRLLAARARSPSAASCAASAASTRRPRDEEPLVRRGLRADREQVRKDRLLACRESQLRRRGELRRHHCDPLPKLKSPTDCPPRSFSESCGEQAGEHNPSRVTDVARLEVPIPWIGSVNLWLLRGEPLTLVDTGPATEDAPASRTSSLAREGVGVDDIELLLITHHHLDHSGLGAWVKERSGAEIAAHKAPPAGCGSTTSARPTSAASRSRS